MSAIYSSALVGSQTNLIQTAPCRATFKTASRSVLCSRRRLVCKAEEKSPEAPTEAEEAAAQIQLDKDISKFARNAATTFAPRASGATQNPAYKGKSLFELEAIFKRLKPIIGYLATKSSQLMKKFYNNSWFSHLNSPFPPQKTGSILYQIFEVQAWLSLAVGGLLSFNLIFPSDQPDIARLIGMWSMWMFTVPSLRARECTAAEKDALNLLFLAIPLLNVGLPFIWKSFPFIYVADCVMMAGVYYWKGLMPFGSGDSSSSSSSEQ